MSITLRTSRLHSLPNNKALSFYEGGALWTASMQIAVPNYPVDSTPIVNYIMWIKPSTTGSYISRIIMAKMDGSGVGWMSRWQGDQWQNVWSRTTTILSHPISCSTVPVSAGEWNCLSVCYNTISQTIKLYHGNLTSPMANYVGVPSSGSGTFRTASGAPLKVGARSPWGAGAEAFSGSFWAVAIFPNELTLEQLRSWQYNPRRVVNNITASVFFRLGDDPPSSFQTDYSRNGLYGECTQSARMAIVAGPPRIQSDIA